MIDSLFKNFMPHGECLAWQEDVLMAMVVGNTLIFLSYFSIPVTLVYLINKYKHQIAYPGPYISYAMFILCCGVGHLIYIINIWKGWYAFSGWWSLLTAFWSIVAAIITYKLLDKVGGMMEHIDEAMKIVRDRK